MTLTDLDGDNIPELLITETGGDVDRRVSIWRYQPEQQTLTKVGSGLRNPTWVNGVVRGTWKLGVTSGDVGAEEHKWIDGQLTRQWISAQRYALHEYLIGTGEPAVRVEQQVRSATGMENIASLVGNLASFRNNLPAGEQPRPITVLVQEARGRTHMHLTPNEPALRAAQLQNRWDEIISRAIMSDPAAFSSNMTVQLDEATKVALNTVATIAATPTTISPTYQYFSIDDELRNTITEPTEPPCLAAANVGAMDWTRLDQAAPVWAVAVANPTALLKTDDDVVTFIRLPNFIGYPLDQVEIGTLVNELSVIDQVITVKMSVTLGEVSRLARKDVARPLLLMNLGRLSAGSYRVNVMITGLPAPHAGKLSLAFAVK
jgi:hypothetical protein